MRVLIVAALLCVTLAGCSSLATPIGYESPEARRSRVMKRVAVDVVTLGLGEVFFIGRGKQLEADAEWQAYANQLRAQVAAGQITQGEAELLWQNAVFQAQNARTQRVGVGICVWQRGFLVCL